MTTQAELDLQARLADMERQLAELSAKVNPLYSGGMDRYIHSGYVQFDGVPMRWDPHGMQVESSGVTRTGVRFMETLQADPSDVFPRGELRGSATVADNSGQISIRAVSSEANGNISYVHAIAADSASLAELVTSDTSVGTASMGVHSENADAHPYAFVSGGPFALPSLASDPTNPLSDGMVWYNTTTDKLYARINGVTKELGGGGLKTSGGGYYLIPAGPSIGTSVSSSASANTYGSWTELRAASGNALYIVGIEIQVADDNSVDYVQVDVGTGASASESSVGEAKIIARRHTVSEQWGTYKIEFAYPIPVAASTRIAVRTADDVASALGHVITLHVIDQADVVSI